VKAPNENSFLFFPPITGIDGSKAGMLADNGATVTTEVIIAGEGLREQYEWWQANKDFAATDAGPVQAATLNGSRMAIRATALVPVVMAVLYLILLLAFKAPKQQS